MAAGHRPRENTPAGAATKLHHRGVWAALCHHREMGTGIASTVPTEPRGHVGGAGWRREVEGLDYQAEDFDLCLADIRNAWTSVRGRWV